MEPERSFRIFTIPNLLSLLRIVLVIPLACCIWHNELYWIILIITIATASDFLDGILARRLNQISEIGKILDPVADKLSIGTILVVLLYQDRVPPWLVLIVLGRDIAILLLGVIYFFQKDKYVVSSNFFGKVTANVLGVMALAFIFNIKLLQNIFVPLSVIFIVISSISYAKNYLNLLKKRTSQIAPHRRAQGLTNT